MAIRTSTVRNFALAGLLALGAGSALVVDAVAPARAQAQGVDVGLFYTGLAPHGEWFFQADFGWVWRPGSVSTGWRPYTAGQWVWADQYGWTWASHEPWGWATYHYGRWYFDPFYGWSWVPGRTWAPAWVSWRVESGFIGWAPLWPAYFDNHPDYRWDRWRHDDDWRRRHRDRDWDRWVFTRDRDFTASNVGTVTIRDRSERDRIFRSSRDVPIDTSRPQSIGRAIERERIEKAVGRPVKTVRVEDADKPTTRAEVSGDRVRMFRPDVKEAPPERTPDKLGVAKEPTPEARRKNSLREEKARLEGAPAKAGEPDPAQEPRGAKDREPAAREKADREPGSGRDKPGAPDREPAAGRDRPGATRDDSPARTRPSPEKADEPAGKPQQQKRDQADRPAPAERKANPQQRPQPPQAAPVERAPQQRPKPNESRPPGAKPQAQPTPQSRPQPQQKPDDALRGGPPPAAQRGPDDARKGGGPNENDDREPPRGPN
ncbi:MAG: DUF6600 domain-containing protein [Candidatus Binatia bacterium]